LIKRENPPYVEEVCGHGNSTLQTSYLIRRSAQQTNMVRAVLSIHVTLPPHKIPVKKNVVQK
jgi:hypothetical protein